MFFRLLRSEPLVTLQGYGKHVAGFILVHRRIRSVLEKSPVVAFFSVDFLFAVCLVVAVHQFFLSDRRAGLIYIVLIHLSAPV